MHQANHYEPAAAGVPPASAGLFYYPAEHRGKFPTVRAALASIGCTGEAASSLVEQARCNASPAIAVSVSLPAYPGDQFAAVIVRRPGGKADLWLGVLEVADEDRDFAEKTAREFAAASRGKWAVFEWVRQSERLQ